MATPWADPRTGRYYLRRQIPAPLRPAFNGRSLHKVALGTANLDEARPLFARENAAFEEQLADARRAIAEGRVAPTAANLVKGWFEGPRHQNRVSGPQRLVTALMQLDALVSAILEGNVAGDQVPDVGTDWNAVEDEFARFDALITSFYRNDPMRTGLLWHSLRWHGSDAHWRPLLDQVVGRLVTNDPQAAAFGTQALLDELLNQLDAARPKDIQPLLERHVKGPASRNTRLRPTMRLRELFREWKAGNAPRPQTAGEYEAAIEDFIEFAGDPPVGLIDADLIYDYRDEAAKLPKSMPRRDRRLPFTARVAKHELAEPKASAATLKKRIGALQALLTYAHQQRWTAENVGRGIQIVGYTKRRRNRRSFEDHELTELFSDRLFSDVSSWSSSKSRYTDATMFWLFLLGATTGARLEEVGQVGIRDVRQDGDIVYLDIDEYSEAEGHTKHVKGDDSIRLIPVHEKLIELGFLDYRAVILDAGHDQLFPDLKENAVGKRTKEASQRLNRIIDRAVSADRRLVFHSLRHAFKAKGNDAGLTDRTLDQICGHAPTSTGGRYGSEPRVRTIHRELHTIDFSCIPWGALAAQLQSLDWRTVYPRLRDNDAAG